MNDNFWHSKGVRISDGAQLDSLQTAVPAGFNVSIRHRVHRIAASFRMGSIRPTRLPGHVTVVRHARDDLLPSPITPEHILDGAPVAHSIVVADMGEGLCVWLWDCTAGRFKWFFSDTDEIVHIIEGAVTVTSQDGEVVRLVAGDVAAFVGGTWAIWDVEEYVKKVAVTRGHRRGPVSRVTRALRLRLTRMVRS